MSIQVNQVIGAKEILGLSSIPDTTAYLALTTAYQDLVSAPASGIRLVSELVLSNEDSNVIAVFFVKLVSAGVDYVPLQVSLSPGERFNLFFPFLLNSTMKLQAKTLITAVGHAVASYIPFYGISAINNFTGVSWTTVYTQNTVGAQVVIAGVEIINTDIAAQSISIQVIDDTGATKVIMVKTVGSGSSWFLDLKVNLLYNWIVQVETSGATGSILVSFIPVDMP